MTSYWQKKSHGLSENDELLIQKSEGLSENDRLVAQKIEGSMQKRSTSSSKLVRS